MELKRTYLAIDETGSVMRSSLGLRGLEPGNGTMAATSPIHLVAKYRTLAQRLINSCRDTGGSCGVSSHSTSK